MTSQICETEFLSMNINCMEPEDVNRGRQQCPPSRLPWKA